MELRDLTDADLELALDIRNRAFGVLPDSGQQTWREHNLQAIAERRILGCDQEGRLAATAKIRPFRQWWHGRSLPMAGVAGVVVAPEARGRGVGRLLMTGLLERIAEQGYPVSALYPATTPLYRGLGWEMAGAQQMVTVPTEALRSLSRAAVPLTRVGPDDAAKILSVVRRIHASARSSGPIDWDGTGVREWLEADEPYAYLADDGFLAYHWEGRDLEVDELVAGSEATARALWALVGSGSSIAATVRACLGPADPLRWLTSEQAVKPAGENRWMLRLVDVPAALDGRGYPTGVKAELALSIEDPHLPANTGAWRLTVADGVGHAERVAPDPAMTSFSARGLAARYAGAPMATLRQAGLAQGGAPEVDALLDAVFTAQPYLLDYF
ncbi:MAG: GNAT family N-acetyltransferase [Micromonosporaceae bacterium]